MFPLFLKGGRGIGLGDSHQLHEGKGYKIEQGLEKNFWEQISPPFNFGVCPNNTHALSTPRTSEFFSYQTPCGFLFPLFFCPLSYINPRGKRAWGPLPKASSCPFKVLAFQNKWYLAKWGFTPNRRLAFFPILGFLTPRDFTAGTFFYKQTFSWPFRGPFGNGPYPSTSPQISISPIEYPWSSFSDAFHALEFPKGFMPPFPRGNPWGRGPFTLYRCIREIQTSYPNHNPWTNRNPPFEFLFPGKRKESWSPPGLHTRHPRFSP